MIKKNNLLITILIILALLVLTEKERQVGQYIYDPIKFEESYNLRIKEYQQHKEGELIYYSGLARQEFSYTNAVWAYYDSNNKRTLKKIPFTYYLGFYDVEKNIKLVLKHSRKRSVYQLERELISELTIRIGN